MIGSEISGMFINPIPAIIPIFCPAKEATQKDFPFYRG